MSVRRRHRKNGAGDGRQTLEDPGKTKQGPGGET